MILMSNGNVIVGTPDEIKQYQKENIRVTYRPVEGNTFVDNISRREERATVYWNNNETM